MVQRNEIIDAYLFLRENNHSIPSETLDFIKGAALAAYDSRFRKAPWPDYEGADLFEGDKIAHPSGKAGLVFYQPRSTVDEKENWLVQYDGGPASRLCLQVGDKGRAVRVE